MRTYIWLLAAAALGAPQVAQATTAGRVTGVAVELDLREPERGRVTLAVRLRVDSGWLSTLELVGLDRDAEQVEVTVAPELAPPEVRSDAPGSLSLRWADRSSAPQAGEHALSVSYTTRQLRAADGNGELRRVAWTLPRWPERVADVQIRVIGPPGISPLPAAEPNLGITVEIDRTQPRLVFQRVELPRTEAWRVSFELPPLAADDTPLAHLRESGLSELRHASRVNAWPCFLGACLGLLVVAKRRLRRAEPAPALVAALESKRFDALSFALCALSAALLHDAPNLALACALAGIATGLERGDRSAAAAISGERQRWFDATTLAGASALGLLYLAGVNAPESIRGVALTCVWLATPLFFSRTRLHARPT